MLPILHEYLKNPVFAGLSATALLGGVLYQTKRIPMAVYEIYLRLCTVTLSVDSRDYAFRWINAWLSEQAYSKRSYSNTLRSKNDSDRSPVLDDTGEDSKNTPWVVSPGVGRHWVRIGKHFVVFNRYFDSEKTHRNQTVETVKFRTLGRSHKIINKIVQESEKLAKQTRLVAVYLYQDGWWSEVRGKNPRSWDTITVKPGQKERILADLKWFLNSQTWYAERGIPYRRGYLFSGPPGTGKTSTVLAIAAQIKRSVYVLNVVGLQNDAQLLEAIAEAPQDAIILIEDIDCISASHDRAVSDERESFSGTVTKAGLLNALDGISTPDGRIFILTTNYPERLDTALIRPGRADVQEVFDYLEPADQKLMAQRFYAEEFIPLEMPVSPAALQAVFMQHPEDPRRARATLIKNMEN